MKTNKYPLRDDSGRRTMSLFLSLYLIVLVFLIALLSASSFSGLRFEVGSKSVRDSFRNHFKAKTKEIRFAEGNDEGFLIHTAQQSSDLPDEGNVFLRELPIVKVVETESGKITYADINKEDYFSGTEISPEKLDFFKHLCGFLKRRNDSDHYGLKFVFGENYGNDVYPVTVDNNYRQAEELAKFINNECDSGADNISIGVDAIDYTKIRIIFSVADE